MSETGFDSWAIVEQLGHRRLAGRLSEVQLAGTGFLRLEIPETTAGPARTQFLAPSSIFAIHPVDEKTAVLAAGAGQPVPIQRWELPAIPGQTWEGDSDA